MTCNQFFLYCAISQPCCLKFGLMLFLWYRDSFKQFFGSYGGHVFVVDLANWAIWRQKAESFKLETNTPVSIICKHCLRTRALSNNFIYFLSSFDFFCLFKCIGPFLLCAIYKSGLSTFNVVSFSWYIYSVKQFWGPLEATFSSWIMWSRLPCARELRASNLKHKDCCFDHLQTFLWKGTLSDNFIYIFLILLTS